MRDKENLLVGVFFDKALKNKSLSNVKIDFESEYFRRELEKRAILKNMKQKIAFALGSIATFKTFQDISVARVLNPAAQLPLSIDLYFGIFMPATLHIRSRKAKIDPT